jgi:hypothetical protein
MGITSKLITGIDAVFQEKNTVSSLMDEIECPRCHIKLTRAIFLKRGACPNCALEYPFKTIEKENLEKTSKKRK